MSISKQKVDTLFPATVDIQRMAPQHASRRIRSRILTIFLVGLILWATLSTAQYFNLWSPQDTPKSSDICPQADVLVPQKNAELWNKLGGTIGTEGFKARAVDWLSGAVKLPWVSYFSALPQRNLTIERNGRTESYDNMDPVGVDPRWEAFGPFHDYLLGAYPLV